MNVSSWFDFIRTPGVSQFSYLNISDPSTVGNETQNAEMADHFLRLIEFEIRRFPLEK